MTPSEVAPLFRAALLTRLAEFGAPEVLVIEADQPNKQGRVDDGLYWRMSNPRNYGWQARRYAPSEGDAHHVEHQLYEVTMTLVALVSDDDAAGYAAHDLATLAQMSVNSLPFVEAMRKVKIGVQRATQLRTLVFTDEADNYAKEVSFDVNVTFVRSVAPETKTVEVHDLDILRI